MVSTITALVIQGVTNLDPDGGGAGVDGNGWVAKATLPYDAADTAFDQFDPSKIVLTVTDPGFASDGSATTRTRTIRGGAILRRQYPNQAALQSSEVGGNLEVYFSLSDEIFAGSTITVAEAEAGYYGDDAAGSIAGVVNSSARAYPKPLFAWLNIQHERATGTHFAVEAVAYHRHGRNGQQVACIEFTGTDAAANTSAAQRSSAPALSDFQTAGQIVEAWKAQVPLAALTQGDLCTVNAVVKPWIGEAWDLSAVEIAWPIASPQTRLRFLCDKTGGYGRAFAYVKAGAVGGTCSTVAATARTTPYPTVNAALTALSTFNNTNFGRANHSNSVIYLMDADGAAVDHVQSAASTAVAVGLTWTEVRVDPLATGLVRFATGGTAGRNFCSLLRWIGVPLAAISQGVLDTGVANAYNMVAVEDCTITYTGGVAAMAINRFGLIYMRNVTIAGMTVTGQSIFAGASTNRTQVALALGVVVADCTAAILIKPYGMIGCRFNRMGQIIEGTVASAAWDSHDGMVLANNLFEGVSAQSFIGHAWDYARGAAIVQNVIERAIVANHPVLLFSGDSGLMNLANILLAHNTLAGERTNYAYTDDDAQAGLEKDVFLIGNIFENLNIKSDDTTGTAADRTGNWASLHHVAERGNVVLTGSANATAPASTGSWLGRWWPEADGFNATVAGVPFVDDQSNRRSPASTGAGGGDYHLTGEVNAAYGRIAAGLAMLRFDMAGVARLDNGEGAAGAYEGPSIGITGTADIILDDAIVTAAGLSALPGSPAITPAERTVAPRVAGSRVLELKRVA